MKVGVLLIDGMRAFDLAIAMEAFSSGAADGAPPNEVILVGPASSVQLSGGLTTAVEPMERLGSVDVIVIPGFTNLEAALVGFETDVGATVLAALRAHQHRGGEIASLCTGAFLLARTGLLDGSAATTHWRYAALLQQRHPQVRVKPNVIHLHDSQRRLWTSAGVTAGVDMCLAIVQYRHGAAAAAAAARSMVLPVTRSGGQAQYLPPRARAVELPGAEFARLHEAVAADLGGQWSVPRLAAVAGVSRRTLQRRFNELGLGPTSWLIEQRVSAAQELLETTDLSVGQVAVRVGLGSADLLRKHFSRTLSISPTRYRESFRRPLVAAS